MKTTGVDKAHHTSSSSTSTHSTIENEKKYERLRQEGEELNFLKQFKQAHEKANVALKGMQEIYGKNALQVVPFCLLVIEIALEEKHLKKAEEMLSLINWILVKDKTTIGPSTSNTTTTEQSTTTTRSISDEVKNMYVIRMNKLYCLLLLEYEAFQEALQRGAHGAYHCSLLFGPEHLYTSELYYSIGLVFQRQVLTGPVGGVNGHQKGAALGMFDKVVDIWYRFLTHPPENTATYMLEHQRLRLFEGTRMLQSIVDARVQALGVAHVATGEVLYTQGLLFLFLGDHTQAKAFVRQALDVYVDNLGAEHPSTQDVYSVLTQIQQAGF